MRQCCSGCGVTSDNSAEHARAVRAGAAVKRQEVVIRKGCGNVEDGKMKRVRWRCRREERCTRVSLATHAELISGKRQAQMRLALI